MTTERNDQIAEVWEDVRHILPVSTFAEVSPELSHYNHVLLAKGASAALPEYVIKIPQDPDYGSQDIAVESESCAIVNDATSDRPVDIPSSVYHSETPLYGVYSFVPGVPLANKLQLTAEEQQDIGRATGQFMAWLGRTVDMEMIAERDYRLPQYPFEQAERDILLPNRLHLAQALGCGAIVNLLHTLHNFHTIHGPDLHKATAVGHADLHSGNLIIASEDDARLTGVIDFGLLARTTPEYELRNMIEKGSTVLSSAMDEYRLQTGHALSREYVEYWSLRRWMATCFFSRARKEVVLPKVADYLQALRPDEDWHKEIQKWNRGLSS